MVRLFIENNEIELDESVQIAITKQFEDLSNPTTIINDWSKTVSIPFTQKNNKIFGGIYSPDKIIVEGTSNVGIYFNPYLKLNFRLQWGNDVIMIGYAKMNGIKQVGGSGTYDITLFGELGKVFQEMQKITFDSTTEDTEYLIDGSEYVENYINRDLVYSSWTSSGQTTSSLLKTTDDGYSITDILGFAPNNSFNDGFQYDTFQNSQSVSNEFVDVLGDSFTADTGISADTAIPDGLTPRGIGEYRSYLQLPFIYWNKLFQIFQAKAEEVTGYTFKLDSDWFNTNNPYWYNLVYMLKSFYSVGASDEPYYVNKYSFSFPSSGYIYWGSAAYSQTKSSSLGATIQVENLPILSTSPLTPTYGNTFALDKYSCRVVGDLPFSLRFLSNSTYNNAAQLNTNNGFVISLQALDNSDSSVLAETQFLLCRSTTTIDTSNYSNIITYDDVSTTYSSNPLTDKFDFSLPINMFVPIGHSISFRVSAHFVNNNSAIKQIGSEIFLPQMNLYFRTNQLVLNLTDEIRSNAYFTLNKLWNNDYNLFGEILKYCKMYRIAVYVDEPNKKIVFEPFVKYLQDYTVEDWTDKVDKSRDFIITPITFENKYVLFNYEDNETKLGENYKEKYGVNYGDYRLVTEYNFNSEIKELFDGVQASITNTDNVLSWENLYTNHQIVYSFPAEIYVYCKDEDNKFVDVFGQFYFHNGLATFDTEARLNLRNVRLTDDTSLQLGADTFFYSQGYNYTNITTYPYLDIVSGNNLCVFNNPKENYTYTNNYSGKNSIYTNFWQNYLNERYNTQNKIITCYVDLSPIDYNKFEFNHFVKIGNQLCMVNKLYDYDITSNTPTKADLITIQDISAYTDDVFTT